MDSTHIQHPNDANSTEATNSANNKQSKKVEFADTKILTDARAESADTSSEGDDEFLDSALTDSFDEESDFEATPTTPSIGTTHAIATKSVGGSRIGGAAAEDADSTTSSFQPLEKKAAVRLVSCRNNDDLSSAGANC